MPQMKLLQTRLPQIRLVKRKLPQRRLPQRRLSQIRRPHADKIAADEAAAEKTAAAEAGPARRKCRIPDDDRMPLKADYHKGGRRTAEHTDLWMLHSMAWAVGEPAHTCASGQHCSCAIVTSF